MPIIFCEDSKLAGSDSRPLVKVIGVLVNANKVNTSSLMLQCLLTFVILNKDHNLYLPKCSVPKYNRKKVIISHFLPSTCHFSRSTFIDFTTPTLCLHHIFLLLSSKNRPLHKHKAHGLKTTFNIVS